jgi:hypothetical protein
LLVFSAMKSSWRLESIYCIRKAVKLKVFFLKRF